MSAHDDNPAAKATALVGAVTQQALSTAGRLAFAGVTTGLQVLGHANSIRRRIRQTGDTALQIASFTPLGKLLPEPRYDDGAELEGHRIAHPPAEPQVPRAVPRPVPAPPAEVPVPAPTAQVPEAAKQVGAPGAATAEADAAVAAAVEADDLPSEPTRDELPIADFDSVSVPSLRSRLRRLSLADLAMLREYEQAHAHRLPVVTMLDNRIAKLAAAADADPDPASSTDRSA
jgi:hypothetical protein